MEYYSPVKREILTHATRWMKPENIVVGRRSQTRKGQIPSDSIYAIDRIYEQAKPQTHKADRGFPGAGQQGQRAATTYRHGVSFGGGTYVGELVLMAAQPGEYTKKTLNCIL